MRHTLLLWVDAQPDITHTSDMAFVILQERIDVERCKEIFPYGLPIVEVRSSEVLGQQS